MENYVFEPPETPGHSEIISNVPKLIEQKKYVLECEEDYYSLLMEINSDDKIIFKLNKSNNLSLYYYSNNYNYKDLIRLILLKKSDYENTKKIFQFLDLTLEEKKMKLEYNKEKNLMILIINKELNNNEIKSKLELNPIKVPHDEILGLLIDEIKSNKKIIDTNKIIINELENKNKEYENRIKILENKIQILEEGKKNREENKDKIYKKENNIYEDNFNDEKICKHIIEFESLKKNIFEENDKPLMIISEGYQGNNIIRYFLNKMKKKFIELHPSQFEQDLANKNYNENILDNIKNIIKNDNILIMKDFDSLNKIFIQKFFWENHKKYMEININNNKILTEVHKNFCAVIIIDNNVYSNLNKEFQDKFNKIFIKYDNLLDNRDHEIVNEILLYLDSVSNKNEKFKIDLEYLLINCQKDDIEGLIFQIKNDMKIYNHWNFKADQEYEKQIIKFVLSKIVPIFPKDIIASLISPSIQNKDNKYKVITDLIKENYNKFHYYNFENFFKSIELRKNIIYTFSKEEQKLFKENIIIENKYGKFNEQSIFLFSVESIKKRLI